MADWAAAAEHKMALLVWLVAVVLVGGGGGGEAKIAPGRRYQSPFRKTPTSTFNTITHVIFRKGHSHGYEG